MENDRKYLLKAIGIAKDGIANGCGPFGAVLVMENKVIAEASNRVILNNDPTAHAEILAIRQASSILHTHDLSKCTLYTSCEPCPMCLGAIYWSGIKKVVYSSDRTDAEAAGFSDKLIYSEIMLDPSRRNISFISIPDPEAQEVFRQWIKFENKVSY